MPEVTFQVDQSKLQQALTRHFGVTVPKHSLDKATYVVLTEADPEKVEKDGKGNPTAMRWVQTNGEGSDFTVTIGSWNTATVVRWIDLFKKFVDSN